MESSWRSLFWNIAGFVVFGLATLALVVGTVDSVGDGHRVFAAMPALTAVAAAVVAVRWLFARVTALGDGILIRGPFSTRFVPWQDVVEVEAGSAPVDGPAALGGASAPAIVRRRAGKSDELLVLSVLGTYGLTSQGRRLGARAAAGLAGRWEQWKAAQQSRTWSQRSRSETSGGLPPTQGR